MRCFFHEEKLASLDVVFGGIRFYFCADCWLASERDSTLLLEWVLKGRRFDQPHLTTKR